MTMPLTLNMLSEEQHSPIENQYVDLMSGNVFNHNVPLQIDKQDSEDFLSRKDETAPKNLYYS